MRNEMQSIERGAAALDQLGGTRNEGIAKNDATAALRERISLCDENGNKKPQATILLELCESLELFHAPDLNGYAIIETSNRREVWPIQSASFQRWLELQYYTLTERAASTKSMGEAINTLEAKAQFEAPRKEVYLRVARIDDHIYIDLGDDRWRTIEINASGWRVLDRSPVMFTRSLGMQALPDPVPGNLRDIEKALNIRPEDLPLVAAWILMATSGRGPYPILILQGEQGSGKSTFARNLRSLIDPSVVSLRSLTRDVRDLLVTATNNHVIVLDNLSGLPPEISDVLCRFATGGGFAERKLYTNRDEVLVQIQRPIILNGIDEIATRGDLLDRAVIVHLPVISDTLRIEEAVAQRRFEELRPSLLGGMCTALSHALRELPNTRLANKPRMADFAIWATAAETAMDWAPGTFMAAYRRSQEGGIETALEASPFGSVLVRFMADKVSWSGTATDLLLVLESRRLDPAAKTNSWPRTGGAVSNALKRAAPLLRHNGIHFEKHRGGDKSGTRLLVITKNSKLSSGSSEPPEAGLKGCTSSDASLAGHSPVTQEGADVLLGRSASSNAPSDDTDASDDTLPDQSSSGEVEVEIE